MVRTADPTIGQRPPHPENSRAHFGLDERGVLWDADRRIHRGQRTSEMIDKLHIDGFRGLDGLNVAPLGHVNVIVGPGNSGKTNLLECAFLFCSNGDPSLIQRVLVLRGITGFTPQAFRDDVDWFWTHGRNAPIEIRGTWNGQERAVFIKRLERTNIISVKQENGGPIDDLERRNLADSLAAYELETVVGQSSHVGPLYVKATEATMKQPTSPNLPGRFISAAEIGRSQGLAAAWTAADEDGDGPAIDSLLRQLDSKIVGVRLRANEVGRAVMRIEHKRLGSMPLEFLGAGIGKALAIACHIAAAKNGLLLIDEFDTSLHVGAQTRIIEFALTSARNHNVQLLISTHSLETLDKLLDCYAKSEDLWARPDDLRVLQLKRANGATEIRNLNGEEAKHFREQIGYDLRFPG